MHCLSFTVCVVLLGFVFSFVVMLIKLCCYVMFVYSGTEVRLCRVLGVKTYQSINQLMYLLILWLRSFVSCSLVRMLKEMVDFAKIM